MNQWKEMGRMNGRLTLGLATFFGVLVAVILPALSHATASGRNGEIALTLRFHTISQVFTVRPDGTRLRQVTHGLPAGEHGLSWSPNGRGLLYTLSRIDGTDRIVKSLEDGSGAAVVSPACTGACLSDDDPTYSPNGKKIAFERAFGPAANQNPARVALFTMNADGSQLTELTGKSTATSTEDSQPQWSPDGTKIAFVRTNTTAKPRNKGAIEIMNADGSNVRRITPFGIDAFDPHWSPNGKRILFSSYAHPVQFKSANLFTMSADGKDRVAITHYTGGTLQAFADGWSPSGTEVVFRRMAFSGSHTEVGGFYILNLRLKTIVNANSNHIRRLTHVRLRYDARSAWGPRAS
jgi:Tol biopolymer transport system component